MKIKSVKHMGKTNEEMKRLGDNRAKIEAQKKGGYPSGNPLVPTKSWKKG